MRRCDWKRFRRGSGSSRSKPVGTSWFWGEVVLHIGSGVKNALIKIFHTLQVTARAAYCLRGDGELDWLRTRASAVELVGCNKRARRQLCGDSCFKRD